MKKLTHQFVEKLPEPLEEGVVYVSTKHRLAAHNCACGCGVKIVTNLDPDGWTLIYDGKTVSLTPSIGNWGSPCRSHYWITNNEVSWAESWSDARIRRAREREALGGKQDLGAPKNQALPPSFWSRFKFRNPPSERGGREDGSI